MQPRDAVVLSDAILQSKVDFDVIAPFIERSIEFERATLQANRLVNRAQYLDSEYEISQVELFLVLLRRHRG